MRKPMGHVKDNQERKPKKLLELAMEILRRKHYIIRKGETYVGWITRYIYIFITNDIPRIWVSLR